MSRLQEIFETLRRRREAALIAYMTAGDPSPEDFHEIAHCLCRGGADILEVGIPFSDPIADGPAIQSSVYRALQAGTTPQLVLQKVKDFKDNREIPVVVLTYFNIVYRIGLTRFCQLARASGVDGLVIADLPVEESKEYRFAAHEAGLDTVFLSSPTTSSRRLRKIASSSSGFIYLVSLLGVTGTRDSLPSYSIELIRRTTSEVGTKPVAVGFGISNPTQVKQVVEAGADGVIVGSRIVEVIASSKRDELAGHLELMVKTLKHSTRKDS